MNKSGPRIFALGQHAVTVEFGNVISEELNALALSLAYHIEQDPFPGFIEAVPAYASTTIFYDPRTVRSNISNGDTVVENVTSFIEYALRSVAPLQLGSTNIVDIPVRFGRSEGPDLPYIAEFAGLSIDETIHLFTSTTYRVYMLGFIPGFAYLGNVDERIAAPRKATPRSNVPKGSVGIAGRQTGIYPFDSPGGWQIIGQTDREMFAPHAQLPCLVAPGDQVRFTVLT